MLPNYGCIKELSCQVLPNHDENIILNTKPNRRVTRLIKWHRLDLAFIILYYKRTIVLWVVVNVDLFQIMRKQTRRGDVAVPRHKSLPRRSHSPRARQPSDVLWQTCCFWPKTVICFLVLRDHEVCMYVVYIWKWSSAHAIGDVSGVASFITTNEQLQ